jgi:tetratricopeptide (TPR) repeat protein
LYYYRGKAFFLEGDFGKAKDDLAKAALINEEDPAAQIGLAATYQGWLGNGREHDPLVEQELAEGERRAKTLLGKADALMAPAVLYDLGFIHELAGKYDDARQRYQEAAEAFSVGEPKMRGKSPYVSWIALARVQQKAGELEAARTSLEAAIATDSKLSWAYVAMAQSFEDKPAVAKEWLRQARDNTTLHDASVDIAQAGLCRAWQDYRCASEAYQRALEEWPEMGNLYGLVGDFYRELSDWEGARKVYKVAAERLRPNDPWAHERFGYVLFQQGKFAESARQYQAAIDLAFGAAYVPDGLYCAMALAQENAGDRTEAIDSYRDCVEASTDPMRKKAAEDKIEQLQNWK